MKRAIRRRYGGAKMPKPALSESSLYLGDNGRCFCGKLRCAGSSSHFTGRDLSGQKCLRIDAATAREHGLRCEGCGKSL